MLIPMCVSTPPSKKKKKQNIKGQLKKWAAGCIWTLSSARLISVDSYLTWQLCVLRSRKVFILWLHTYGGRGGPWGCCRDLTGSSASVQGMGEEEGCMELKAQIDRKQLSFSWQKAKDVSQQHSRDTPEQDLPAERGQGKRKCIVSPRLNFTSYYIKVTDYTVFFSMNNLVAEKQSLETTKTSNKFSSNLVFNFGWHDMLIVWLTCIVWVKK